MPVAVTTPVLPLPQFTAFKRAASSPSEIATSVRSSARTSTAGAAITAVVLTKNSERRLAEALAALAWCDEVIVFDTGSTDNTTTIAQRFSHVRLHCLQGAFPGFGLARQQAVSFARNDWILSVDSDEVVSEELATEICHLELDSRTVYVVPFENYYQGRHITTCGWAPDRHERLFNRTVTNFCDSAVHERLQTHGLRVATLQGAIRHYSYAGAEDFLRKMAFYSELFAEQNVGRRPASSARALARSAWAFFKSYVLERGMVQGREGLLISAYKSQTVFWKYTLLQEANLRRTS